MSDPMPQGIIPSEEDIELDPNDLRFQAIERCHGAWRASGENPIFIWEAIRAANFGRSENPEFAPHPLPLWCWDYLHRVAWAITSLGNDESQAKLEAFFSRLPGPDGHEGPAKVRRVKTAAERRDQLGCALELVSDGKNQMIAAERYRILRKDLAAYEGAMATGATSTDALDALHQGRSFSADGARKRVERARKTKR